MSKSFQIYSEKTLARPPARWAPARQWINTDCPAAWFSPIEKRYISPCYEQVWHWLHSFRLMQRFWMVWMGKSARNIKNTRKWQCWQAPRCFFGGPWLFFSCKWAWIADDPMATDCRPKGQKSVFAALQNGLPCFEPTNGRFFFSGSESISPSGRRSIDQQPLLGRS